MLGQGTTAVDEPEKQCRDDGIAEAADLGVSPVTHTPDVARKRESMNDIVFPSWWLIGRNNSNAPSSIMQRKPRARLTSTGKRLCFFITGDNNNL